MFKKRALSNHGLDWHFPRSRSSKAGAKGITKQCASLSQDSGRQIACTPPCSGTTPAPAVPVLPPAHLRQIVQYPNGPNKGSVLTPHRCKRTPSAQCTCCKMGLWLSISCKEAGAVLLSTVRQHTSGATGLAASTAHWMASLARHSRLSTT